MRIHTDERNPFPRTAPALLAMMLLACGTLKAQSDIENVFVETYYISDANDATDTIGGPLVEGSRTYRVFIDLCDDCALRAVYGDENHPLRIQSTAPFFNNLDRGKTFGHEVNNSALDENTVALDSWLSFGGGSNQLYGVPKNEDSDGADPLTPNDGGSAEIPGGLLANADPEAGIPILEQDGLIPGTGSPLPPNFIVQGISPDSVFKDSTLASVFASSNTRIACSTPGVKGPTSENKLLLAQLTTAGELMFTLNIEVEHGDGSVTRYVATDTLLAGGETPNGLLSYPPMCGCTDPNFLEYDPTAGCDDGSCATAIVFGCLDTNACNFDPDANFNIPALCCYGPDSCNGLDVSIVCPGVGLPDPTIGPSAPTIFPNPMHEAFILRMHGPVPSDARCYLLDRSGRLIRTIGLARSFPGDMSIDVADLPPGLYALRILSGGSHFAHLLVKN